MSLNLIHGYRREVCARVTRVILLFVHIRPDGGGVWNHRWFGVARTDLNASCCLYEMAATLVAGRVVEH